MILRYSFDQIIYDSFLQSHAEITQGIESTIHTLTVFFVTSMTLTFNEHWLFLI